LKIVESFADLKRISTSLGIARKGKEQYSITEFTVKSIFAQLRKAGFSIEKRLGTDGIVLKNSVNSESIILRKSKSISEYNTFDTFTQKVNGVQTDIRIPIRR